MFSRFWQLPDLWIPQRDRVLTNIWQMKWYTFWDALTRQRTDGALVRLITPVYPNEEVAQAEARLTARYSQPVYFSQKIDFYQS